MWSGHLNDAPYVFSRMAEFAACNAGTKAPVADTDRVVFKVIREVVITLCHSSNEDRNAFVLIQAMNVIPHANNLGLEAEGDFAAVRGKVVGDRILDDLNQFLLRSGRPDLVSVEKLNH